MKPATIIAIVLVLILAAGAAGWYAFSSRNAGPAAPSAPVQGQYTVTLTDNGFEPSEISITQGQTVTFRTTAGKPFWPASNPHPAHTDYPEFDPQLPVRSDATWSFTFQKVGTWGYHDHLAPYYTGTIHVLPAGSATTTAS